MGMPWMRQGREREREPEFCEKGLCVLVLPENALSKTFACLDATTPPEDTSSEVQDKLLVFHT